jgi:hypothetical protein
MGFLRSLGRTPAKLAAACCVTFLAWAWTAPAGAIETDQYYAWGREIADSTDVINAKVNVEIQAVLDRVNAKRSWPRMSCHQVLKRIRGHFRLFIFHDLELWVDNCSLVERVPATPEEELRFRERYLYSNHGPFDVGTWMPPSPTIELAGVRVGTDKLTHFFSEGWLSYQRYRRARGRGLSHEEAERRAIDRGILIERFILGTAASGVFSLADLEADYEGLLFFRNLCDPESPGLRRTDEGWRLVEPFDFRDHVSPEWDESYQPSIFTARRWEKVEPVLLRYCPLLHTPEVALRRRAYATRDRLTATETRIGELVETGKLLDPDRFSIEKVCSEAAGADGVTASQDGGRAGDSGSLEER